MCGRLGWFQLGVLNNLLTSIYSEYDLVAMSDAAPPTGIVYPSTSTDDLYGSRNLHIPDHWQQRRIRGYQHEFPRDRLVLGLMHGSNSHTTQLTAIEATQYQPLNFLDATVSGSNLATGAPATWKPRKVDGIPTNQSCMVDSLEVEALQSGSY